MPIRPTITHSPYADRFLAHEQGSLHYYTGRPCKRGHDANRYVSNGGCVDCMNLKAGGRTQVYIKGGYMPRRPVLFPEGITEAEAWGAFRWFEEKGGPWLLEAVKHAYRMGLVEGPVKGQSAPVPPWVGPAP